MNSSSQYEVPEGYTLAQVDKIDNKGNEWDVRLHTKAGFTIKPGKYDGINSASQLSKGTMIIVKVKQNIGKKLWGGNRIEDLKIAVRKPTSV